jgi:lipopolysaccharide export system protein LptA
VIRGERVVVDMTTGVSRVESGKAGTGVRALIQPGGMKDAAKPSAGSGDAKTTPARPARTN